MHRDNVRIDDPCHVSWDAMTGDEVRRHCDACDKTVHDLSAMRHDDAAALLRAHAGDSPCVRYTTADDGTLRFRDLVPRASLTRKLRIAAAASLLAACSPRGELRTPEIGKWHDDVAAPVPQPPSTAAPSDACDPAQPPPSTSAPPVTVDDPRPLTLEEQQRTAEIDRALEQVRHRMAAIDESIVYGQVTRNFEIQGAVTAGLHKEAEAAERARLLELEREALEAEPP